MVRQGLWIPSLTGHLERSYLLTFWLRRFNSVSPTVDHEPLIMTLHGCLTFSSVPACHPAWSCQEADHLSPKLRTINYSHARPGRDTWVSQGLALKQYVQELSFDP